MKRISSAAKILVPDSVTQKLRSFWDDALVVRLLGKNVGYMAMKNKLPNLLKPNRGKDIMDLGHRYFKVKLDEKSDRVKAMERGPWMMFNHYLVVRRWFPKFHPEHTKINRTLVWVRFPGLNLLYYDDSFLMAMASSIGTLVMVDKNMQGVARGHFARVCVEIDLQRIVIGKVWHDRFW